MQKRAQLAEGFFKKLVTEFGPKNFASKPFETILKATGWMILWKYSRLLGLLALVLEGAFGVGPSTFGKFIDKAIGAGEDEKLDLSESNLKNAATKISSSISNLLEKEETTNYADDILYDIMEIKGCVDINDAITAIYVSRIVKTARPARWWRREPALSIRPSGRVGFFKDFLKRVVGGRRLGFANIIFGFLKMLAMGILGVSAVSGLKSFISGKPSGKPGGKPTTKEDQIERAGVTYYANDTRNVVATILAWLDKVEGFEKAFKSMRPTDKSIQQSVGFQKLLRLIEQMNNANIQDINKWKAFVGPSPQQMVKMILPGAIYEPIGVGISNRPAPVKSKKELTKLLSEVL